MTKRREKKRKAGEDPAREFRLLRETVLSDQAAAERLIAANPALLEAVNGVEETTLMWLTVENHVPEVEFLIQKGAEVDTRDFSAATPLIHASQLGYGELVSLLLRSGADAGALDNQGESALVQACRYGHIGIAEALLAHAPALALSGFPAAGTLFDELLPRKRAELIEVLAKHGWPAENRP